MSLRAEALPAQVQLMNSQDIQELNLRGDYANLFRKIAGVKAVNYGQGQIGVGIMMRGFRSGAGNEVAIFVDGVPQNFPSATTHGRSEISWLTPEAIDRLEIIKGPVSALYGDFALGGVINIVTKKHDPSPNVSSYGGTFGDFRGLGVASFGETTPTVFFTNDYFKTDGYRENSYLKQWSSFNKGSVEVGGGILSLRYNYFTSDYGAPGYWPIDWVKSGRVYRERAVNTADGGYQKRSEIVATYEPACGQRGIYATLYTSEIHYIRYYTFLPLTGSQYARQDDRRFWGARFFYNLVFEDTGSLAVGMETRQDSGEAQQYRTIRRQRMSPTTYDYDLRLSNWAIFLQGQIKPHEKVKIVGGVRWDYFKLDIGNLTRPENSGAGTPFIRSPKIGFVVTPAKNLNIFGNIGCGFRSPAAFEMSPRQAARSNFDLEPAVVQTYDIGFNTSLYGSLYLAADYYHTYMQREIRTDSRGNPVVVGDTVRKGYELDAKFFASDNLNFFINYAWVDARVKDPFVLGQDLVPEISEHSIKGGISILENFGGYGKVQADLYYEYASGAPYYGSGPKPIFGPDFDSYNLKLMYSGNGWSSFLSVTCKPREYASDYTWVNNELLVYDPPFMWSLSGGISYTFW